jgi:fructose-specific PTS system IIA-like component
VGFQMSVDYRFNFPLANGLHARPASHFEAITSRFRAKITLIHERTCYRANLRSVLSMVSADVKYDDPCCIQVDGEDEEPALDAVRRFVRDELPHCDESVPELHPEAADPALPRSLTAAGLKSFVRGRAVSGGIGQGPAVIIGGMSLPAELEAEASADPPAECLRAINAITAVGETLQRKISAATQPQEVQILKSHAAIARDVELAEKITSLIVSKRRTAAQAIVEACKQFAETLRQSQSAYLRERTLDVQDICMQLLEQLGGFGLSAAGPVLTEPCICLADHLTPGQLLGLNRQFLKGLVLAEGGTTSHTTILARSMSVPTLVGVAHATAICAGQPVIVDGELGLIVTEITEPVRRYYAIEQNRLDLRRKRLESFVQLDGMTADGHAVEIGANISSSEEAKLAFQNGAQGIGLFRTEMLFMDRSSPPPETEQAEIYTAAATAARGRPVIIRLLDIGGDKPVPYLKLPAEENPFLGYRGARIYREFAPLVKSQLRAILRASVAGDIKILLPMICCVEEVLEIRQMLAECVRELADARVKHMPAPQLGVMLEIPSLAFLMPELCAELDFFSIGSNDLTQYFLAADRANPKVANLYAWSHPAFLRLLKSMVDQAKSAGKWIGLCGELGDQPSALPLLIGLGLDEISVSPGRISAVKASLGTWRFDRCRQLLDEALRCSTRGEVEILLATANSAARSAPQLTPELIIAIDGRTKEEVIKQISDRLNVAGRVAKPQLLEEAIWKREDTYSTGFGFGFALPHCKTDHLTANSIVIAKLATPVEWGSLDDSPVDVVILLAIRGQESAREHMKIFARLSRLVMRDEFRDRLRGESDPVQLTEFIKQSLDES